MASDRQISSHLVAMHYLKKMGLALRCEMYVATNDHNRMHCREVLGKDCVSDLERIGLAPTATEIIQYIDMLWMRGNTLISAFEVEISTGVYPGLLRMSDLMVEVPNIQLDFYVVSPDPLFDAFVRHSTRPTFVHTGVSRRCRFIPFSKLAHAWKTVQEVGSYLQPDYIGSIALPSDHRI